MDLKLTRFLLLNALIVQQEHLAVIMQVHLYNNAANVPWVHIVQMEVLLYCLVRKIIIVQRQIKR